MTAPKATRATPGPRQRARQRAALVADIKAMATMEGNAGLALAALYIEEDTDDSTDASVSRHTGLLGQLLSSLSATVECLERHQSDRFYLALAASEFAQCAELLSRTAASLEAVADAAHAAAGEAPPAAP